MRPSHPGKRLLLRLFAGAILSASIAQAQGEVLKKATGRLDLMGLDHAIPMAATAVSPGMRSNTLTWGPLEKRNQGLSFEFLLENEVWSNLSFTFLPEKSGSITLNLIGLYLPGKDRLQRRDVLYDNFTAEGTTIVNGDFEKSDATPPTGWSRYAKDGTPEGGPIFLSRGGRGVGASRCVMTWHDGSFSQNIPVTKGQAVTIRFSARVPNEKDYAMVSNLDGKSSSLQGPPKTPDAPLSLASVANMGFADDVAGDGKGGWSDQGAENDFSGFEVTRTNFQGIRFDIVDPDLNRGRAVATMKSENLSGGAGLASFRLSASGAKGSWLYLLHSSCWTPHKGKVGTVTIRLKSGKELVHDVEIGREIADWWAAGHLPNGLVVVRKPNKSATVGIFLSRLKIADEPEAVEEIRFETEGKAIWIVVGATLSSQWADFSPPRFTVKEGKDWKAPDFSKVVIAPGSALDFSALVEAGPAGKYGRAISDAQGRIVFEKRPNKPVRFNAFNIVPSGYFSKTYWSYLETPILGADEAQTKKNTEALVAQIKRGGYNMVRLQSVELMLQDNRAEAEIAFNPTNLDRFDYFIYCLKKEGIYLNIDIAAYKVWLKGAWDEGVRQLMKERFLVDPASRGIWERGAKMLMTHRNPYTGLTLAEDPALVMATFFNEQDIPMEKKMFEDPSLKPLANQRWREFLKRKYPSETALRDAWKTGLPAGDPFETAEFARVLTWEKTARGNDANIFMFELGRDMIHWYQKTLKAIGFPGLTGQFDVMPNYRGHAMRNENTAVLMHMYHNHPSAYTDPGSRTAQNGILQTAATYWRIASSSRYLNRPLCVTEYGAGFWGRFRHEEGLVFPAYSALQDFSMITIHTQPVIQKQAYPLRDFMVGRDPVLRAGQALAALLYMRGDVAASTHTTGLSLSRDFLMNDGNLNRVMSSDQSKLSLLTRFGLVWDEALPKGHPAYPKVDLKITPASGGTIIIGDAAATVVEGTPAKDLDGVIGLMKQKGMLSGDNASIGSKGIFQTDTRELTMKTGDESLLVQTPRTEGAALKAGQGAALGQLAVKKTTTSAAIAASALDGAILGESRRILFVYSTDALNTGFEASDDRVTLIKQGVLPVLMQTGVLDLQLKTKKARAKLSALGMDGLAVEEIPVKVEGGVVKIRIDTGALKNGPTPFFELVME
jgi:hypothetical protein